MLGVYETFGLGFTEDKAGKNALAHCPFCSYDEPKFSVAIKTGQYRCLHCGEKGNTYAFLQRMHARLQAATSVSDYKSLEDLRGIPWRSLRNDSLAFDEDRNRWLIPVANGHGSVSNLLQWNVPENGEKSPLMSMPGCSMHLRGIEDVKPGDTILICEGYWDEVALKSLLEEAGISGFSVVSAPGSNTFKDEWVKFLLNRDVVLLYDNDKSGRQGIELVTKKLAGKARSIRSIHWPKGTADRYDVRDFCRDHGGSPAKAWRELCKLFSSGKTITRLKRDTFKSVVNDFRKVIRVDSHFEDAMAISFATIFAQRIPGDPIWMLLVGPPGSGKSLLLKCFGSMEACVFISKLTATSFVSGYKTEDGSDPSLLARIQNKTLVVKDFTCIKSMPLETQQQLYGLLRDASDGRVDVPHGNAENREYKGVWFSILGGVTDIIHGDNRSAMGERFLKLEFVDGNENNREAHIRAALANTTAEDPAKEQMLLDSVQAFLSSREVNPSKLPKMPRAYEDRLVALAQVVSYLRARVEKVAGDMLYRPDREIGTRPAVQLKRLSQLLAFTWDCPINDKVYDLVRRVALDTCIGWPLEIVAAIMQSKQGRLFTDEIAEIIGCTMDFARKQCMDLMTLEGLTRELRPKPDADQSGYCWSASPDLLQQWKKAELHKVKSLLAVHHKPPRSKKRGKYSPRKAKV